MTKLCPRGKAAAKRKFKVYPSAYANAYASKICAGKIKDPSGVKRKDFKGPKPAGKAKGGEIIDFNKISQGRKKNKNCIRKSFITNVMAKPPSNEYFTPVKKRTSIGRSPRSRPKNKNKRRQYVKYRGQG